MSHAPQWSRSTVVSVQCPPQSVRPLPQESSQEAFTQTSSGPQALLQVPQCRLDDETSKHPPPHSVCGGAQEGAHELPEQTSPAGHGLPHAPQWSGSVAVSTQPPPQEVSAGRQSRGISVVPVDPSPAQAPNRGSKRSRKGNLVSLRTLMGTPLAASKSLDGSTAPHLGSDYPYNPRLSIFDVRGVQRCGTTGW